MDGWQPIETAPKKCLENTQNPAGPTILLYGSIWHDHSGIWAPRIFAGFWLDMINPDWQISGVDDLIGFHGQPTHWMPLPAPPQSEAD